MSAIYGVVDIKGDQNVEESKHDVLPYFDEDNQIVFTADCVLYNREEQIAVLGLHPYEPDGQCDRCANTC